MSVACLLKHEVKGLLDQKLSHPKDGEFGIRSGRASLVCSRISNDLYELSIVVDCDGVLISKRKTGYRNYVWDEAPAKVAVLVDAICDHIDWIAGDCSGYRDEYGWMA